MQQQQQQQPTLHTIGSIVLYALSFTQFFQSVS